ncbi:MAG: glycosyltransferase family 2 protein [Fusicatenibacter sp.]|nr:glycosyltransferase family 2 protein [Lachnospiraceae bacterium]MDY2939136.1 glycosyltransferase family 2 protein [Fusicatenibacter sp.]
MEQVAIVIPNYNGRAYLEVCLEALEQQTFQDFAVYLVDNGSTDDSCSFVAEHYPEVRQIRLDDNYGFSRAVNEGIRSSKAPYVILLNNDTQVFPDFVEELYQGICQRKNAFACSAKLISYRERDKIDDAGNYYNLLGWAFARGKGKSVDLYEKPEKIFAACAGAAIYRREVFEKIGLFDEEHFAYLEDTDIGYRARIFGYENYYLPSAKVYHVGSGTSGSRYNLFKIRYSSRNNIYLIYKNMPIGQIILNLPALFLGFLAKFVFFSRKGFGKEYLAGIKNGLEISKKAENREKKIRFRPSRTGRYLVIEWELFLNVFRRFV